MLHVLTLAMVAVFVTTILGALPILAWRRTARMVGGHAVGSTVSVGVAVISAPTAQIADLMAAADRALYRAKAEGRNRSHSSIAMRPARSQPSKPRQLLLPRMCLRSRSRATPRSAATGVKRR